MPFRETNSNFSFHHKSPVSFGQPDVRLRNLHLRRPESGLTPFPEEDLSLSIYPFLPLLWRRHILQSRLEHSAPDLRISKRGMCEMASGGPSGPRRSVAARSLTCLTTSAVGFGSRSKCHPLPFPPSPVLATAARNSAYASLACLYIHVGLEQRDKKAVKKKTKLLTMKGGTAATDQSEGDRCRRR